MTVKLEEDVGALLEEQRGWEDCAHWGWGGRDPILETDGHGAQGDVAL